VCQVLHPWFGSDGELIRWRTLADDPGVAELRERYQTRDGLVQAFASQSRLSGAAGELDAVTAAGLVDVSAAPPRRRTMSSWRCGRGGVMCRRSASPAQQVSTRRVVVTSCCADH
jgi:hypothetical protein